MGISPSSVHDQTSLVSPDGFCECLGTFIDDNVSPTVLAWSRSINDLGGVGIVGNGRDQSLGLESRFSHLTLDGRSIDRQVSKVSEQLLSSVLGLDKLEQLRGVVDECRPGFTGFKDRVGKESNQERNVGLDTSDSEFDQGSEHLSSSDLVGSTTDGTFDEQRVVVGSNLSTSVS